MPWVDFLKVNRTKFMMIVIGKLEENLKTAMNAILHRCGRENCSEDHTWERNKNK